MLTVEEPPYLKPFVLPTPDVPRERHGRVDLYLPGAAGPRPAVLFVHGGPIPADIDVTPRDWPVYRGYGGQVASRGLVAATVDHRLYGMSEYPTAAGDVTEAVDLVRADPRVDADRIALWFFSGGGLLIADWLRDPPPWVRCLAATYPILDVPPGADVDPRFRPVEAAAGAGDLPIVLTRVGRERPQFAATVDAFVATAPAGLRVIDVPNGQHSFDCLDHTDESRAAVTGALDAVVGAIGL